jgi:hypothetical protein
MRKVILIAAACLLAGCGGGNAGKAVDACEKALQEKATGKPFAIDRSDMRSNAVEQADGVFVIESGITFDPGMPKEVKQRFNCSARMNDGGADVISLNFIY